MVCVFLHMDGSYDCSRMQSRKTESSLPVNFRAHYFRYFLLLEAKTRAKKVSCGFVSLTSPRKFLHRVQSLKYCYTVDQNSTLILMQFPVVAVTITKFLLVLLFSLSKAVLN